MPIKTIGWALTPALREPSSSPLPTALTMPEDDTSLRRSGSRIHLDFVRSRRPIFFILVILVADV
jgi:hypothetical protein